jgi:hypothetical protein
MTKSDILCMALEAGFNHPTKEKHTDYFMLERFAALVAEHEREQCAKVCEDYSDKSDIDHESHGYACAEAIRNRT